VLPLAENDQPVETRLKNLAIVCANCHRMLHRSPWTTIEDLKAELK
jgi:5-methylcytosine-specific restriction protein A